jgi:hypothetical protein
MPKYFLFNKEQVGPSSTNTSDTGVGISVISVSADHVSFITATSGAVNIVFNNAGVFDHVDLGEGESLRKTSVTISCNVGEESKLVEQITNFISSPNTNQTVMKFDFVNNTTSFLSADVSSPKSIYAKVHNAPEDLKEKYILYNPTGLTSHIVNGIQFTEDTYPILDLDAASTANFSGISGATFTSWNNSSQLAGATAYNFNSPAVSLSPQIVGAGSGNGLGTTAVYFGDNEDIQLNQPDLSADSILSVYEDYTIYMVIGLPKYINASQNLAERVRSFKRVYGSSNCAGPFSPNEPSRFQVRHGQLTGVEASMSTLSGDYGTIPYEFPSKDIKNPAQTCYVFIVRRDIDNNMYLHNHEGDLVGYLPGVTGGTDATPFRTDEVLAIEFLGTNNTGDSEMRNSFVGYLARFGVIKKDIGSSEAARLAIALYERYKPTA